MAERSSKDGGGGAVPEPAPRPRAPGPLALRGAVDVLGVTVTHPDKVLCRDPPVTKLELARYWERVSRWALPHLVDRPLRLWRCPEGAEGEGAFMGHAKAWGPAPLRRVLIPEKAKIGEYLIVESAASLVALVQMGAVELHTWNTRYDLVEQPDRLVFDLDPGPEVGWPEVVKAALLMRRALRTLGLESWVKTSGGAGLHVLAPIARERDWSECLVFARGLAAWTARVLSDRFTTRMPKKGRERKILIDYLRNNRTQTLIAAFSPTAGPGSSVSVPLSWDELSDELHPERFTLATVERRLAKLREDPWEGYFRSRQRLIDDAMAAMRVGPP